MIKKADLARVREIEFTELFGSTIKKLMEALGITRKIPKQAGTTLKTYKATGELQSGVVAEGETIPLSHYKTEPVAYKEITLKKWRKATTAEAIIERGYDQAVEATTDKMLQDVQKGIRKDFFDFLGTGMGIVFAPTFQAALARAWGKLQILFEDDSIEAVYFMNPMDVADYLATANITMQSAFGMNYVKDFLGLGTVFFNSSVPEGNIFATAKNNLILYYIPVNGADLQEAFTFTSDETGYIGIHEEADYTNMTAFDTVVNGMELMAERLDGVVVAKIDATPTLGTLTVGSAAGTESGDTKLTVSPDKESAGNVYKFKTDATTAPAVTYGQNVKNWTAWDGVSDITATTGHKITVVECDSTYSALNAGTVTVASKA